MYVCMVPTAGQDYVPANKTLVFAPGSPTSQCIKIPILTDECLEQTESFNVSLSSGQECVRFVDSEVQVYITEDDST